MSDEDIQGGDEVKALYQRGVHRRKSQEEIEREDIKQKRDLVAKLLIEIASRLAAKEKEDGNTPSSS